MINILIKDETAQLKSVVLGTGESFGGVPAIEEAYDPKSREHILDGTFPKEEDIIKEMEAVANVLKKHGVQVYRPNVLPDTNQVFARDIGFVIGDKFIVPNIIDDRAEEKDGINFLLDQINPDQVLRMPKGAYAEGGDVMPWKEKLYIGYSEDEDYDKYQVSRTNRAGVEFLRDQFPNCEFYAFELKKSDTDPKENALHLDCCFQPVGNDQCIIYKGGFKNEKDYDLLVSHFGKENCIEITKDEMYEMNSNVFSISPEVIVSEQGFTRLNDELERRGFKVERVPYSETAKMEGLLRCSTLPLERAY
ncbi:dimethylarginine dimethylaminohydrolase family protein [Reichenbachiella sp.]|uniref:dimethylarginine dimethylaminohydrolase family protein n=1 Tax=Reichenbachiella sp. TaxID=2184521 RepID=UPI003B5B74A2